MTQSTQPTGPIPSNSTSAQASDFTTLAALQNATNSESGPRSIPARVLPVPTADLSPAPQVWVATPYGAFFDWNAAPRNDDEWHDMVSRSAEASLEPLAQAQAALGLSMEETAFGGVPCYVFTPGTMPETHRNHLVVNIHGGAHVFGPGLSGTVEAMLMAAYGGYRMIAVDYRMPPDAPFPAALDDAVAVWRAVVETHDPRRAALVGTSAGGGLVLATALRAKEDDLPLPGAIAPLSPWSDLTETGDSYQTNEWIDNVLVSYKGYLGRAALLYAHGRDLRDPELSPIYGNFVDFPPAILIAGTRDLFLSNTVRTHRKLRRAGVEAEIQVFEGLSHAQFNFDLNLPETREIYEEVARFFDKHLVG